VYDEDSETRWSDLRLKLAQKVASEQPYEEIVQQLPGASRDAKKRQKINKKQG
jgi:hypothetical protein